VVILVPNSPGEIIVEQRDTNSLLISWNQTGNAEVIYVNVTNEVNEMYYCGLWMVRLIALILQTCP
jgi:hypothetical protein